MLNKIKFTNLRKLIYAQYDIGDKQKEFCKRPPKSMYEL